MAIKGSLKEASLPDVIQLLFLGRRTGCLAVNDRQNFGYIYLADGWIVYAAIVNRRDRLGDILVRNKRITPEQLQTAIARQESARDKRLGEILVDLGAVAHEELREHIRLQIEEAVYYLFTWTSGTFNFEAGVRAERQDLLVHLNPEYMLLEGARRLDEWSQIETKIPSFDLIFTVDRTHVESSDVVLSAVQEHILELLDGKRDVRQVVDESGLIEFEAAKALYGLITAGFVHRSGTSGGTALPKVSDARIEEHWNLGVAFHKTGMLDEALREFRRVAELKPAEGSAQFYLGLIALKQARWADAVEHLRLAAARGGSRAAVSHNLGFALEQLGRLDEAAASYGEAASLAADDPRVSLGRGIVALKRHDFASAGVLLARARELIGDRPVPAAWYWAATLVSLGAGDSAAAIETARAGVDAYPARAVLRNNLAVVLELNGDVAGAEPQLREAFAEEPALPQVSKNLADLMYRAGRYDEAHDAYQRAAKLRPDLGDDLYFKLGNIAYKRRDPDGARAGWERAAALNPSHQLARANLERLDLSR